LASQQLVTNSEPYGLKQLTFISLAYQAYAFLPHLNLVLISSTLLLMHPMIPEAYELEFVAVTNLFLIRIYLLPAILLWKGLKFGLLQVWLFEELLIFI
jgi:hypothetical protein